MNEDRRRFRRYEVAGEGIGGTLAGRERQPFAILTLSRGGLLVTMGLEPPLGHVLDLEILLGEPAGIFRSPGKVVFIGEDKAAPRDRRYRVGIALSGESSEDGALLDRFIRERFEASRTDQETESD